jgi:Gpi18-like mannosyltransferase
MPLHIPPPPTKLVIFMKKNQILFSVLALVALSKIIILVIGMLPVDIPYGKGLYENNYVYKINLHFLHRWEAFDGQWYLHIAEHWYNDSPLADQINLPSSVIYYPLYPVLIRLLSYLTNNTTIAGLLISYGATFVFAYFFLKLVRLDFSPSITIRALVFLLIFPTAVFFSAVYTESLFLAFCMAMFYYARKQHWWLAAICGGCSALTRSIGVLLFLPFVYMYITTKHPQTSIKKASFLAPLIIPLASVSYILYTALLTGDILAIPKVLSRWGRTMSTLPDIFHLISQPLPFFGYRNSAFDLFCIVSSLLLLVLVYKQLRREYFIYAVLFALFPLCTGTTMSMSRYLLVVFPFFIVLAINLNKVKLYLPWILMCVLLLFIATIRFSHWYWIG